MKELAVQIRVRNNRLLARRRERGLSQAALAVEVGIPFTRYCDLETLRRRPFDINGEWQDDALKLAIFYSVCPDELFPDAVLSVENPSVDRTVDGANLMAVLAASHEPLALPSHAVERRELREAVTGVLSRLTPREARTLRQRFGIDGCDQKTYEQIAEADGVTRERVRQIEAKAIRKLRHPKFSRATREFL